MKLHLLSVISLLTFSFVMKADHDHLGMSREMVRPAVQPDHLKNTGVMGPKKTGIMSTATGTSTRFEPVAASIVSPSVLSRTPNSGTVSSAGY